MKSRFGSGHESALRPSTTRMNPLQDFLDALRMQDWSQPGGPMRLSHKLEIGDYGHAELPANVRTLMERIDAMGGAPCTAGGNLNRAFIEGIFESLQIHAARRESILAYNKVLNEPDIGDLHRARQVAHAAGFLAPRQKKFQLTRKGKKLLAPDQAGEFYRELFSGYFQRFNLGYDVIREDIPAIQETFPAIVWRMDAQARDWTPVEGLAPRILLPMPLVQVREAATTFFCEDDILSYYIYKPLERMGLLDHDGDNECPFGIGKKSRIKTSRLWRKFLWFDWQP
jgi:hypothetical protein